MTQAQSAEAHVGIEQARETVERLRGRLRRAVRGRDEVIDLLLVALLAGGHVLLEDYPGSGKTTLAKALGEAIGPGGDVAGIAAFRRVQFTPDLLPSDVTGTSIFEPSTGRFVFRHGPIFAHVVLADEINRTSPKVQAAMLEAMAEGQVTVDNVTHPLDPLFFVIATQNPLDVVGTYPLPSPQLDRFLFKIKMTHISREAELEVLSLPHDRHDEPAERVGRDDVVAARRAALREVYVAPAIKECLVDIARATREQDGVLQGASTRALVLMLPALQALALLRGRDFVSGDDIELLAPFVFMHRLELTPAIEEPHLLLAACMREPLERLTRGTLRR